MAQTKKQYALFNVPVSSETFIPAEDAWLFNAPFKTFDLDTQEKEVLRTYRTAQPPGKTRVIGAGRITSRIILKSRLIHFGDYTKVTGVDAVKDLFEEKEQEAVKA